jgi:hypothetical protein
MHDEASAQKSTERDCRLEEIGAFDLYVRGISRNLASLLEQLVLLREMVEGKRDPPSGRAGDPSE